MQARLAALQGQLGHLSGMDGAPQPGGGGVALARAAGAFMPGFGSKDGNSLPPGSSQ
ncbi:unnamed protein product, partial [Cladocopium goreaui]